MKIRDLRVIITGAGKGLGRVFALECCREGARVAAVDLDRAAVDALVAEAADLPGQVCGLVGDVSSPERVTELVARAARELGGVNALINNAGIARDGQLVKVDERRGELLKMPRQQWLSVLDVNLTAPFYMAREVVAHMIEARAPGVIINMSSVSRAGNPGQANYSAAKAGLVASTRAWALELAQRRIRVAAIAPGFIDTSFVEQMAPEALAATIERVPLRRLGTPLEVFAGVRFIVECELFNGCCLDIDGGLRI